MCGNTWNRLSSMETECGLVLHSQEVGGEDAERSTEVEPQGDGVLKDREGQLLARREPNLATEDRMQATFQANLLTSCGT